MPKVHLLIQKEGMREWRKRCPAMIRVALLICTEMLCWVGVSAQEYHLHNIGLEAGLSQSSVSATVRDPRGFVWFATQDGLNRYDGYDFQVIKNEPFDSASLSANRLTALLADPGGYLWVGTAFSGLNLYDPIHHRFRRIYQQEQSPGSLSSNLITGLFRDSQGQIWVGTGNGLNRLTIHGTDPFVDSLSFSHYEIKEVTESKDWRGYVHDFLESSTGEIWLATPAGPKRFRQESTGALTPLEVGEAAEAKPAPVFSLAEGRLGRVWLGTAAGLQIWDGNKIRAYTGLGAEKLEISELRVGGNGDIWVGTGHGLFLISFDEKNQTYRTTATRFQYDPFDSKSLNGNMVLSIYPDPEHAQAVWVGTYTGGVSYISPNSRPFYSNTLSDPQLSYLASASLSAILKDRSGVIWAAVEMGLLRHDPQANTYRLFKSGPEPTGLNGSYVSCLFEDRSGRLWAGTPYGLQEILPDDRGRVRFRHFDLDCKDQMVFSIDEDETGLLIIGTRTGIQLFDPKTGVFEGCSRVLDPQHSNIQGYRISDVYRDRKGRVWVGSSMGLLLLEGTGSTAEILRTASPRIFYHDPRDTSSLRNQVIFGIVEDGAGRIWIGTMNGLLRVEEQPALHFRAFTERDGLINNMLYAIMSTPGGNELWMSSNGGLTRLTINTLQFDNFQIRDGLQSNEFNDRVSSLAVDGEMLFGGVNGYTRFFPAQIKGAGLPPRVWITQYTDRQQQGITLAGKAETALELPYADNSFSLEFIGLEYTHPADVQYAYQLEGWDKEWVYCGKARKAFFSSLPPGSYQFRVKAANGDGIWSEISTPLPIVIRPPFWQQPWFFLMLALLAAGLLWLIHYRRVQVRVQRVMELERVRKSTAADFHDELGHKLTIISLFGEILKKQLNGSAEKAGPHLDKIIATSNSLYYSMKDLLWVLDPEKDSVWDMLILLKDFGDELFDKTGVAFRTEGIQESQADFLLPMNHKRHIVLIFKEVMNNALKHSGCRNAILHVDFQQGRLELRFSDDGSGFELSEARSGNGINNLCDRAEKVCGTLDITSDATGTRVQLVCEGVGVKGRVVR